jgi:hypothetical protein
MNPQCEVLEECMQLSTSLGRNCKITSIIVEQNAEILTNPPDPGPN